MDLTDQLRIETPEQIDLDIELAGLGTRFLARLWDWLIKIVLSVVVQLGLLLLMLAIGLNDRDAGQSFGAILAAAGIAFVFVLWVGYDIFFELRSNGRTPGKRYAGCRVVLEGGAPVDVRASCVRNFLAVADFLPMFYLFGALMILMTQKKQRLGDLAAGTIVVRDRGDAPPADAAKASDHLASPEVVFTAAQLTKLTADDRLILQSFFQRQERMEPKSRAALAERLAGEFRRRTGAETEAATVPFLASLLRDLERRQRQGY